MQSMPLKARVNKPFRAEQTLAYRGYAAFCFLKSRIWRILRSRKLLSNVCMASFVPTVKGQRGIV